jgi:ABC-2 type transport system permease protein
MSASSASTRLTEVETDRIDSLLAAGRPRRRAGALVASATFGRRALLKIKHDPKQLVDSAAIPILFTVLFTYLFGGAIGGSTGDYLTLLLPGVLTMSVAIVTMYGGARLAQDLQTGVFERFRGLPVWRGAFVLGGLLSDAVRFLLAAAIVLLLGMVMGYRPNGGALGVVAAVALAVGFGLALSLVWAVVALILREPAVVAQPSTMPGWLQAFVHVNPLTHVATAARHLMNGGGGAGGAVVWSLTAMAVLALVCVPITFRLYSKQS